MARLMADEKEAQSVKQRDDSSVGQSAGVLVVSRVDWKVVGMVVGSVDC